MKKADRVSTYIFRFLVGLVGLAIAAIMLPILTKDFDLHNVILLALLLVLFLGYAFGYDKQMHSYLKGLKASKAKSN